MCGIAGMFGNSAAAAQAEAMVSRISHRGPDGCNVVSGAQYALGHARLAIIDIESGQQPMASNSGRWRIVFNGEIYNYREIKSELQAGYDFKTQSDTEAILALVERFGVEQGLARLDGMFAIALYDEQERTLHLVRDHYGIKPLYFSVQNDGTVLFASEFKAFLPLLPKVEVDEIALIAQLLCRFIPAPKTGVLGVSKLRPGQLLKWQMGQSSPVLDQRLPAPLRLAARDAPATVAATAQLLEQAVKRQTVSDVPIGTLLSGGVDSAIVTKFASAANSNLHTYCVGYGANDAATEFEAASESAALLGTQHHNIEIAQADFVGSMRKAIWHLEEPVATTSSVSYLLLCEAVAKERKVVLSGQGADEPWGGYSRHRFEALLEAYGPAMKMAPSVLVGLTNRPRLVEIMKHLHEDRLRWVAYRSLFPQTQIREAFGAARFDAAMQVIDQALDWASGQAPDAHAGSFNQLLTWDSYTDLSDNLLLLGDKLSMASSLEVRVPMLDVTYAAHVSRLPTHAKRRGLSRAVGKAMHKDVAEMSLPAAVVHRKKKGFETPLQTWLQGSLGQDVMGRLKSPHSRLSQHMPLERLMPQLKRSGGVAHETQQQIFSMWMTEEWLSTIIAR